MKKDEQKFQTEIIKAIQDDECFVFNVHGGLMQKSGMPDMYISWAGVFRGWVELKFGSNRCSTLQKIQIERLKKAGDTAIVMRKRVLEDGTYFVDIEDETGACLGVWLIEGRKLIRQDVREILQGFYPEWKKQCMCSESVSTR